MRTISAFLFGLIVCPLTFITGTGALISEEALRRFNINEKEWSEAQDVINKLLDESIASRVTEAEHDVTHLLEQNIAEHLKKKGNKVLAGVQKDCGDKLDHCHTLVKSGVCKTSRNAMKKHCARSCGLCAESGMKYLDLTRHMNFVIRPKRVKARKQHEKAHGIMNDKTHRKVMVPKSAKTANSARRFQLVHAHELMLPEDTLRELHSLKPLLTQRSKTPVKLHQNDLDREDQKIHDAQKLLEYAKVLQTPKEIKNEIDAEVKFPVTKIRSTVAKKTVDKNKDSAKESSSKSSKSHVSEGKSSKSHVSKGTSSKSHVSKAKSSKSHVSKAKSITTPKGVKLENLSKTITYKHQKYKITPVIDWKKISKVLKKLGYKAVHIVGVKDRHIQSGMKEHLKKHGIHNTNKNKLRVATESFVSAVHRHKTWRNKEFFDANCHKMCLVSCVSSCAPGCCKEHDKVSIKTGRPNHCHPACAHTCIPSCGSGCCSSEDEQKRGHHFLHYQRIEDYHKAQDDKEEKEKKHEDSMKCHPQCKETCVPSCDQGCCSDEQEKKRKDEANAEKDDTTKDDKEKIDREKAKEKDQHPMHSIYTHQARMCPSPCPSVCAPSCMDSCCSFGQFAPHAQDAHPGLTPNIPYPKTKMIPANAFACRESCKFSCTYDCPRDCCQPEEAAAEAMHADQVYSAEQQLGYPQNPAPLYAASDSQTCPNPCPGNCFPSCTMECCTSALGFYPPEPVDSNSEVRSSTRKVIHIAHIIHPVPGALASPLQCPVSCLSHCTPACVRSGCCDRRKRRLV